MVIFTLNCAFLKAFLYFFNMEQDIQNVELELLQLEDFKSLMDLMKEVYPNMDDPSWTEEQLEQLITKFPEGQVTIKVNGQLAGCALAIIVDYSKFNDQHTYKKITGNYSFDTHKESGDILYGIDVFVKSSFRGLRLGRRLYEYRKQLCENLNLKGIVFGGRIPNYHTHAKELSPKEYIEKVRSKEIHDPVLNFHLSNDF